MKLRSLAQSLTLIFALAVPAMGQGNDALRDYRYIVSTNSFLKLDNAAGIGRLPIGRIAVANGEFSKGNGGLKGPDDSANDWQGGVATESYIRISDKVAFYGRMDYSYFQGEEMGGSLLAGSSSAPLNFYESVDTTAGRRNREMYDLTGAMAYTFNPRWSAGVKVNYRTGNRSKMRDPRSRSSLMDIDVSAGTYWSPSSKTTLGAALAFSRNLEALYARQYGVTDKTYYINVDYGDCYGIREIFMGDEGFVSLSNARYLDNTRLGGSLQLHRQGRTERFHQLSYRLRSGYFGKRASSSVVFCEFGGHELSYGGELLSRRNDATDRFSLDADFGLLNNNLNVYQKVTEPGKPTVVTYVGKNNIRSVIDASARLAWDAWRGVQNFRSRTAFGAALEGGFYQGVTTIYPFERTAQVIRANARGYGERNIVKGARMLTFRGEASFAMGFGNPATDKKLASSSSPAPLSFDDRLNAQFEYETAPRAGLGIGCTYTRIFTEKFAAYVRLQDGLMALLSAPQYLDGRVRNVATLTVGCSF